MSVEVKRKYIFFGPEIILVRTHENEHRITVNKKSESILILSKDGKKTEVCLGSESEFVKSFQDINKRHDLKNDYNVKTIRNYTPDELKILAQFELTLACLHPVRCYYLDAIIEPLLSVMRSSEQDIYVAYEAFAESYIEAYTEYDVPLEVEIFFKTPILRDLQLVNADYPFHLALKYPPIIYLAGIFNPCILKQESRVL